MKVRQDDSEVDHFHQKLQETIHQPPKKDILVVQGDWNAKVWKDAQADWGKVCGPYCNVETNERGLRLLRFGGNIVRRMRTQQQQQVHVLATWYLRW